MYVYIYISISLNLISCKIMPQYKSMFTFSLIFINYFLVPPFLDHLVRSLLVHLHCKLNKLHSYGPHETASKDINISITYYVQNKNFTSVQ